MITTCPKCGWYYADDSLAFCFADGYPLTKVDPESLDWTSATRAVNDKANSLRRLQRRRWWRWSLLTAATMLLSTMGVYSSFSIERTAPPEVPVQLPVVVYRIGGRAFESVQGKTRGLPHVEIKLSGAKSASTTTDANGYYSFVDLTAGSYTVSARSQMTFTKPSVAIINLEEDLNIDFQVTRLREDRIPESPPPPLSQP
jgi:hypothetical protein